MDYPLSLADFWQKFTQGIIDFLSPALGSVSSNAIFRECLHYTSLACILLSVLALPGILFMATCAQMTWVTKGRTAYEKCGRQLVQLALALAWLWLAGSRIGIYLTQKVFFPEGSYAGFMVEVSWILLGISTLLISVYFAFWRPLKKMPALHITLGMISAIQGTVALLAILISLRLLCTGNVPEYGSSLPELSPATWDAPQWRAVLFLFPLIFASGAGVGAVWLLFRRKNNDFGRDYYNRMLAWCAGWARNAWLLLFLFLSLFLVQEFWQTWQGPEAATVKFLQAHSFYPLWLIPVWLWQRVRADGHALRHKLEIVLACLLTGAFTVPFFRALCAF